MLTLTLALLLTQTQPAVRRSAPAADDPGMVVRQAGTASVTCTNCQTAFTPDGGSIGSVTQGRALDGGTGWGVYIEGGTLSVSSSTTFDGGSIGYLRMPDGGALEVYTVNAGSSGGGWVPDGGFVGLVGLADGGGVFVTNASLTVTGPLTDAQLRASAVPVSAASLPLPSGAATEATLSTRAADSTITARLNTLGQKTAANSTPVVLASDQTSIPVTDNGGSLTVDGTVSVSGTVTTSGTTTAAQGTPAATASRWPVQLTDGTDLAQVSAGGAVLVDGSGTTQPVSGSVTVTQATGTNLHVVVDTAPTTTVTGTVAATQSGTWNVNNISGTVSLPTGASTSALQTTGNTSLSNIDTDLDVALSTRVAESTFTGRFPAAAALADATANPSLTSTASYLMGYNGTTWDRLRKNANGLLVDVQSIAAGTNYIGKTRVTDGTLDVSLLNSAPGSDTGQVAIPVRIISSLAGGAGGTSSSYGSAFPASGTAAGFSDGTNMSSARTFDADTGGGTQNVLGVNLRVGASGGSAEAAAGAGTTSASTLRVVLPTDQTVIPVSDNGGSLTVDGTVAATQSGTWNITNVSGTVSLPTGAATAANQTTLGSQTTKLNDGTDTALISAAGALLVDGSATTQPVSGTVGVSGTVTVSGTVDTELPAAAALADATANPTITSAGALNLLFNGTTWDRMRGDTTNGLLVNVSDSFLLDATFTGRFAAGAALSDNFANPTTTSTGAMNMLWDGATWDRAPGTSTDGMLVNLGLNNDVTITSGTVTANAGTGNFATNLAQYGGVAVSATNGLHVQPGTGASFTVAQATASNLRAQTASESATASAVPATASAQGLSDGTNLRIPRVYDTNTDTGTEWTTGTTLRVGAFGGSQAVTFDINDSGAIGLSVAPILKYVTTTPTTTSVTCSTTATAAPASVLTNRATLTLVNNSAVTIYIGGSGVTTSNGIPLLPGASFMDDVVGTAYYCRVASGTADLRVLEN